jgi:hypothetical protein
MLELFGRWLFFLKNPVSPDKLSKLQATYELKAKLGTSGVERPESGRVRSGLLGCFPTSKHDSDIF